MKTIIANMDKSQSLMIIFTKYEPLRNPAISCLPACWKYNGDYILHVYKFCRGMGERHL